MQPQEEIIVDVVGLLHKATTKLIATGDATYFHLYFSQYLEEL